MAPGPAPPPALGPADQALFDLLTAQNLLLRSGLCTLARMGVGLRKREPERAAAWADLLSTHPMFKAGQFLFDLMEWEDFMLDGPPPPLAPQLAADVAVRVAEALNLQDQLAFLTAPAITDLPELQSGFYLYRDVVLGLIELATAHAPAPSGLAGR